MLVVLLTILASTEEVKIKFIFLSDSPWPLDGSVAFFNHILPMPVLWWMFFIGSRLCFCRLQLSCVLQTHAARYSFIKYTMQSLFMVNKLYSMACNIAHRKTFKSAWWNESGSLNENTLKIFFCMFGRIHITIDYLTA